MISLLSQSAPGSKSFLWTFPECPVRIHVNLQFIEQLRQNVMDVAPPDREVGGLLIGKELSQYGDIEVCDYLQLPPGSAATNKFVVCSASLSQAIRTASPIQGHVIGFYRTHLEHRIQLRPEDQACIRSQFQDPWDVFLLIRPHNGRASAGFFFWQDGSVVGGLTFPFSTTELKSRFGSSLVGGYRKDNRLPGVPTGVRRRALAMSSGILIGFLRPGSAICRASRCATTLPAGFGQSSSDAWIASGKVSSWSSCGVESSGSGYRGCPRCRSSDLGWFQSSRFCAINSRSTAIRPNTLHLD
jgi:hypothetical protein